MFFKAKRNVEDVKQSGGNHIGSSGMYPVELITAIVNVSKNGSTSVEPYVDYEGRKQVIYGNMRINDNDGSDNEIGRKLFNQLVVIADLDSLEDPVEVDLPVGKRGADKTVDVLEDIDSVNVIIRIQMVYGEWNGKITEKTAIKGFYREDRASAEEIVTESEVGVQYEKDMAYVDNITYKDGLTAEDVAEWIAKGRPDNRTGGSAPKTAKKSAFGKKRFGKSE